MVNFIIKWVRDIIVLYKYIRISDIDDIPKYYKINKVGDLEIVEW